MGMSGPNEIQKLTPQRLEFLIKLEGIFMPAARKRRDELYRRNANTGPVLDSARFVHYTSAEAALSIITNKRIWMRNAMCMSDYREVQHGFEILQRFFSEKSKLDVFVAALDDCAPGAAMEAINLFNQNWNTTRFHTYIASISEHLTDEDQHGRLSMWRAFGGNTARVAFVFNIPWNSGGALALNLMFSPVDYLSEGQAHQTLFDVVANIKANHDFLRSLERQVIVDSVFAMLISAVTCLKHEGFREEREWRAIYSPYRLKSDLMESSIKVIAGVPQTVYSIPIDEKASPALAGLEFSRIFDRLIIGPSQYSWPMYETLAPALVQAGVPPDVVKARVCISGIPIRT
jgi:hypothetical protein